MGGLDLVDALAKAAFLVLCAGLHPGTQHSNESRQLWPLEDHVHFNVRMSKSQPSE